MGAEFSVDACIVVIHRESHDRRTDRLWVRECRCGVWGSGLGYRGGGWVKAAGSLPLLPCAPTTPPSTPFTPSVFALPKVAPIILSSPTRNRNEADPRLGVRSPADTAGPGTAGAAPAAAAGEPAAAAGERPPSS